jgi:nicotinamide-nucleotide amidase
MEFYSPQAYDRAKCLGELLQARQWMLATAESCTGGGIGYALTSVSGSSNWYGGGVVAYSNSLKQRLLGVSDSLLRHAGAVSAEVAESMAKGIRDKANVDAALSITGIAGPGGGTVHKPVGLIWLASMDSARGTRIAKLNLGGSRDQIRSQAIVEALNFFLQDL